MATATAPARPRIAPELIEDRWSRLMVRQHRFENEPEISENNSKAFYKIDDTLDRLAAGLVGEVRGDQLTTLDKVKEGIWEEIESRLTTWAKEWAR